jgi:hypothetical protein
MLDNFNPLNDEQIRETAPSVFSEQAQNALSDRYAFVPTYNVVNFMRENGWFPVEAKEVKTRKAENKGFQRHMIRFRHPEVSFNNINNDKNLIDILLTNSHDGKSSFTFQVGVFRLVCSNGLVVQTADFGTERVRHFTTNEGEDEFNTIFTNVLTTLVGQVPHTVDIINKMQNTVVNDEQVREFALKAATVRFQDKLEKMDKEQLLEQLVQANREEDTGNSLWRVFNTLQEKLIKGGYSYLGGKKRKPRKARSLNNIMQSNKVNTELFSLAYEYVN